MADGAAFAAVAVQINTAAVERGEAVVAELVVCRAVDGNQFAVAGLAVYGVAGKAVMRTFGIQIKRHAAALAADAAVAEAYVGNAGRQIQRHAALADDGELIQADIAGSGGLRALSVAALLR